MEELYKQEMEELYKQYDNLEEKGKELINEGKTLVDLMLNEINRADLENLLSYVNDWQGGSLALEKLKYMRIQITFFTILKEQVYNMENEKDRFVLQKTLKELVPPIHNNLDKGIEFLRMRKFGDYRCIDWTKQIISLALEMKQFVHI